MEKLKKWIHNYIDNVDIAQIEWVKFNAKEMQIFYDENYFDEKEMQYVRNLDNPAISKVPLGLHYLSFNFLCNDSSFLLGVANNNIGKKTIIAAISFLEEEYLFSEQEIPITYITSVEVNSYFRRNGIYKRMCEEVINFIDPNQHLIISMESNLGKKCGVSNILQASLIKNGFNNNIWANDGFINSNLELRNIICQSSKADKQKIKSFNL